MGTAGNMEKQQGAYEDLMRYVEQGVVPNNEQLAALRGKLVEDRVVSLEEADLIFEIKHKVAGIEAVPAFQSIYIDGITSHVLFSGDTPGALDNVEYIWLREHFAEDHDYDELEKALLINIELKAETVPANFLDLVAKFKG